MDTEIGELETIKKRLDKLLPESIEDYGLKEEMLTFVEQDTQRREFVKNQRRECVKKLEALKPSFRKRLLISSLISLFTVTLTSELPHGWVFALFLASFFVLLIYGSVKVQKSFVNLIQSLRTSRTSEEQPFVSDEVMKKLERYKLAKEYHKLPDETKVALAKKLAKGAICS